MIGLVVVPSMLTETVWQASEFHCTSGALVIVCVVVVFVVDEAVRVVDVAVTVVVVVVVSVVVVNVVLL